MNRKRKTTGRRITAAVCVSLLSAGMILPAISYAPIVKTVRAEEISERTQKQLQAQDYVDGEALVFEADREDVPASYRESPLLSQAEEVFAVDTELDHPDRTFSSSEAAAKEAVSEKVKGTIKLVRSSIMSTQELMETLYKDPAVLYVEPNYIVDASEEEKEFSRAEEFLQKDFFEKNASENDFSSSTKQEDKEPETGSAGIKKKEQSSDFESSSPQQQENENREEDGFEAKKAEDEKLVPSNFGPDSYTSGEIPDMTEWQWENWNSGNLAGTYTHSGTVDLQYSEWKTQTREQIPEYVVAVLDLGIDETNPDLADVLWTGDVFGPGGDSHGFWWKPTPVSSSTTGLTDNHGTHIAGIIAAQWNGQGISGIASNVKLMSLRFDQTGASIMACLSYAKEAVKQGVNLIAINNSWGSGSNASDLVSLALTDLGNMGVVNLIASGNDDANNDHILDIPAAMANNPYSIVVNSIAPNGMKSSFSNYGMQTTDVMAPGSLILSTVINRKEKLGFMGEINAHSPEGSEARNNLVSYTSFDDQSVNPFEFFTVYTDENDVTWGSDLNYPVVQPAAGTFDGTGALSIQTNDDAQAGIVSNVKDLSGLETKPRYASVRACSAQPDLFASASTIKIPVIYTHQESPETKEYKIIESSKDFGASGGNYSGFEFDLSKAEELTEKETAAGITGCFINWKEFSLIILAARGGESKRVPGTIYFDSIALGSCRYPYDYMCGTSMAAPSAAGVLAVIAGQHADDLGQTGTKEFAEKLAALVKGAAVPQPEYDQLCGTGGVVSVEGANDPGPAISGIEDRLSYFTLTGYFMDEAAVTLDGAVCTYTVHSKENDRFVLRVEKPEGCESGMHLIAVQGANGKKDRSIVQIRSPSGREAPGLYDHANLPLPDGLATWDNYDLAGYNRRIYLYQRTDDEGAETCSSSMFAYDPDSRS
ncbi:MAG: S8 family serine peptidase, partial [Erysipelotrichaceae bacterium]|nr:S8 family serine peptidase [Erysipelotrichaceae bacterium]